jgi:hypothetical protein
MTDASMSKLREGMSGEVLAPGDPGYEEARRIHNGLIDRRPAVIARCRHSADVAHAGRRCSRPGARDIRAWWWSQRSRQGCD